MKELHERSPTLPRTSKKVAGNDGNSPEKLTVNSAQGFEAKNNNRGKISLRLPAQRTHGRKKHFVILFPANNSSHEWYRMKELHKRSPTLPLTSKKVAGNDGNSPEKLTVNSSQGFEAKNNNRGKISITNTSNYKQGPSNTDPPPAKPTQATTQGPKHRKRNSWSYELNQRYPTPSNSAESSKQHKTGSEHLPQQARMEMLTYYTREMSSCTSPSSSKHQKAISKRSVSARGVQRYHSYFNRSCLPSAIEED
ncbi:hypothetical protein F511_26095 [Dorcoceras hygrometricum]|uniref:Uncharacterized protein n=1 Tax=Dorcoceras hygrometricum TaxID=472368 RepID=A0A2Z7CIN2_9LAMI|nr:hypothetical protein F511_26095 [Dorcoceras hygrometricum]